jgi:hypothetical protein
MELPPLLRRAVDNALNGTALSDLAATAAALSDRYREERHDIKPRVISDREALAYRGASAGDLRGDPHQL